VFVFFLKTGCFLIGHALHCNGWLFRIFVEVWVWKLCNVVALCNDSIQFSNLSVRNFEFVGDLEDTPNFMLLLLLFLCVWVCLFMCG